MGEWQDVYLSLSSLLFWVVVVAVLTTLILRYGYHRGKTRRIADQWREEQRPSQDVREIEDDSPRRTG